MGGQMHQSNAAAAALYDHAGAVPLHGAAAGTATDAGDAVMARWLQSAGLQHLASPLASNAIDQRLLPNLLMQVLSLPPLPLITPPLGSYLQYCHVLKNYQFFFSLWLAVFLNSMLK